jgi:uncharacterized protein YeaO (DUF488 family)
MNLEHQTVISQYHFYDYNNWNASISPNSLLRHKCHTDARVFDNCKNTWKVSMDLKK